MSTDRPANHGPSGEPWTVHRATDSILIIILDMIPAVFGKLKDSGFFFDPVARDIETNFIPSLLEKVKTKVCFYTGLNSEISQTSAYFYTHHMIVFSNSSDFTPIKLYFSAMRLNWLNLYLMSLSVT